MAGWTQVDGRKAGPNALGILIPPLDPTILVLRPRALSWDCVLLEGVSGMTFRHFSMKNAQEMASHFLESFMTKPCHVEVLGGPQGEGFFIWIDVEDWSLMACARRPGQPYQPQSFEDRAEANVVRDQLHQLLCSCESTPQEIYLNLQHFSR